MKIAAIYIREVILHIDGEPLQKRIVILHHIDSIKNLDVLLVKSLMI